MTVGDNEALPAWAAAISREWPVSAAEIVKIHKTIAIHSAKTWAIPWLVQELLRGKRIAFVSLETLPLITERDIAWYDDVLGIEDSKPIKLRRRTIDVPEVAALLLPKETSKRRVDHLAAKILEYPWIPLTDPKNPLRASLAAMRRNVMGWR